MIAYEEYLDDDNGGLVICRYLYRCADFLYVIL